MIEYWYWLVLGGLLCVMEMFVPTFFTIWLGVAAVLVGVLMAFFPDLPIWGQLTLFSAFSAILSVCWFYWIKPMCTDKTTAGQADKEAIGAVGVILATPIEGRRGVVRFTPPLLGEEDWEYLSSDTFAVGDTAVVVSIAGNTLTLQRRRS